MNRETNICIYGNITCPNQESNPDRWLRGRSYLPVGGRDVLYHPQIPILLSPTQFHRKEKRRNTLFYQSQNHNAHPLLGNTKYSLL